MITDDNSNIYHSYIFEHFSARLTTTAKLKYFGDQARPMSQNLRDFVAGELSDAERARMDSAVRKRISRQKVKDSRDGGIRTVELSPKTYADLCFIQSSAGKDSKMNFKEIVAELINKEKKRILKG